MEISSDMFWKIQSIRIPFIYLIDFVKYFVLLLNQEQWESILIFARVL